MGLLIGSSLQQVVARAGVHAPELDDPVQIRPDVSSIDDPSCQTSPAREGTCFDGRLRRDW